MDDETLDIAKLDYLPHDKRIKRLRSCCTATEPCGPCSKIRLEERILEDAEYSLIQRRIIADRMKKNEKPNRANAVVLYRDEDKKTQNMKIPADGIEAFSNLNQLRTEVWGPNYHQPSVTNESSEIVLQDGPCGEAAPKLFKCRECKMAAFQKSKPKGIFCRFFHFRCLRVSASGTISSNGFMLPDQAVEADKLGWLPTSSSAATQIDPCDLEKRWNPETAVYILANVGDQFCELKEQEQCAKAKLPPDTLIAWKKVVDGVREMCDVCETTIFNFHWVCHKCGFVVCIDCQRRRALTQSPIKEDVKNQAPVNVDVVSDEKDSFRWLVCSQNNRPHISERLVPTVIIPDDCLERLCDAVHDVRRKWGIRSQCACFNESKNKENHVPFDGKKPLKNEALSEPVVHPLYKPGILLNGSVLSDHAYGKPPKGTKRPPTPPASTSNLIEGSMIATPHLREDPCPLFLLADAALAAKETCETLASSSHGETSSEKISMTNDSSKPTPGSTLRDLLTLTKTKKPSSATGEAPSAWEALSRKRARLNRPGRSPAVGSLDDLISSVVEQNSNPQPTQPRVPMTRPLKYYVPRYTPSTSGRDSPIRIHALSETKFIYPDVPHSWLCDGRLLCIHDPDHQDNGKLFQEQWKRGQPVIVFNVHKSLTRGIWRPEAFGQEFGHIKNDLVNCRNGHIMHALPMSDFWEGFANLEKRLVDQFQNPLVLKLKDWPPTEDFAELMPQRFGDLMRVLPMAAYTHRDGILNLAGRLPDFCVKPDLGPKMYNAYGMARYPQCGTTNLHLDISDAVNVMVYIGKAGEEETVYRTIELAGVDVMTKRRLEAGRENGSALPGALWHIFDACDADAIRDLLNKVAMEIGEPVEADHDPIHDQAWYLDAVLRDRLHKEYGVTGYAIVQCLGDSVFIPAGAPHQVLNLNSCIKAAEDFVSPEHVSHCFRLTQEFRHLSETHTNHEDKLQVKNIIYHTVKDAVSILLATHPDEEDSGCESDRKPS